MEYFIVFLPLLGAFIAGFFGNKFDQKYSQLMTSLFVSISSILSIIVFLKVLNYEYSNNLLISSWIKKYKWIAWVGLLAVLIVAIELIYTDIKVLLF